jgi:hypothetical protein
MFFAYTKYVFLTYAIGSVVGALFTPSVGFRGVGFYVFFPMYMLVMTATSFAAGRASFRLFMVLLSPSKKTMLWSAFLTYVISITLEIAFFTIPSIIFFNVTEILNALLSVAFSSILSTMASIKHFNKLK